MVRKKASEPRIVRPDDIDPHHDWDRPLQAPGHTQVDFEERVNFRRLHDYRLARTRAALADSGLGALLCFDQHNIRYTTSTVIGEWARDKLTRYCAAHRQRRPVHLGLRLGGAAPPAATRRGCTRTIAAPGCSGMRGAIGGDVTLFRERGAGDQGDPRCRRRGDMPLGARRGRAADAVRAAEARASRCATASR